MKYFVIDTETVGIKCGFHEITEISILNCETLEQVVWMVKIKHPERADKRALMVTNKTLNELLSRGRYIEDVLDEINSFLQEGSKEVDEICMIAHNASFDRRFIEDAFTSNDKTFIGQYWLCTVAMAKKFNKTILKLTKASASLEKMLISGNVKNVELNAHSAEVDVRNTFKLWKVMTARGMSNTEFIKLSPALMPFVQKKPIKKRGKKAKEAEYDLADVGDIVDTLENFEEPTF